MQPKTFFHDNGATKITQFRDDNGAVTHEIHRDFEGRVRSELSFDEAGRLSDDGEHPAVVLYEASGATILEQSWTGGVFNSYWLPCEEREI